MRVDIHCHLLPGIDDGAKDLDQALAMVGLAVADGITDIICTPHHFNGVYHNEAHAIRQHCQALQTAIEAAGLSLQVHPGAENHIVPELPQALQRGEAMTLGDLGRHVLVELPVMTIPHGTDRVLKALLADGLIPIIVHPERNDALRTQPQTLADWVGWGCLSQVTAQSLTGQFGPQVQAAGKRMISLGAVHCIASDAHRDRRRIPALSPAHAQLSRWFGQPLADCLTDHVPAQLLQGQAIDTERVIDALGMSKSTGWAGRMGRGLAKKAPHPQDSERETLWSRLRRGRAKK